MSAHQTVTVGSEEHCGASSASPRLSLLHSPYLSMPSESVCHSSFVVCQLSLDTFCQFLMFVPRLSLRGALAAAASVPREVRSMRSSLLTQEQCRARLLSPSRRQRVVYFSRDESSAESRRLEGGGVEVVEESEAGVSPVHIFPFCSQA
jgi:hypothetical protein